MGKEGACIASSSAAYWSRRDHRRHERRSEHGAQEPFFLGEAAALYDTKAGEAGITYAWELGDQETIFGRMCNNDVVLDIIKYEPVKVGSKPI